MIIREKNRNKAADIDRTTSRIRKYLDHIIYLRSSNNIKGGGDSGYTVYYYPMNIIVMVIIIILLHPMIGLLVVTWLYGYRR